MLGVVTNSSLPADDHAELAVGKRERRVDVVAKVAAPRRPVKGRNGQDIDPDDLGEAPGEKRPGQDARSAGHIQQAAPRDTVHEPKQPLVIGGERLFRHQSLPCFAATAAR